MGFIHGAWITTPCPPPPLQWIVRLPIWKTNSAHIWADHGLHSASTQSVHGAGCALVGSVGEWDAVSSASTNPRWCWLGGRSDPLKVHPWSFTFALIPRNPAQGLIFGLRGRGLVLASAAHVVARFDLTFGEHRRFAHRAGGGVDEMLVLWLAPLLGVYSLAPFPLGLSSSRPPLTFPIWGGAVERQPLLQSTCQPLRPRILQHRNDRK